MKIKYWIPTIIILMAFILSLIFYIFIIGNRKSETVHLTRGVQNKEITLGGLQKKDLEDKQTSDDMEAAIIVGILGLIGVVVTNLLNPKLVEINHKIDHMNVANSEQHKELFSMVKTFQTRSDIELALRTVLNHVLEASPTRIAKFINYEGEQFINWGIEIMNSQFDASVEYQARIKISAIAERSLFNARIYNDEFRNQLLPIQRENTDQLLIGLSEIVQDDKFNSKHNRFRILCEGFLHKHLTCVVRLYSDTIENQMSVA